MPDTARFMSCGTSSIAWGAIASRPKAAPTEIVSSRLRNPPKRGAVEPSSATIPHGRGLESTTPRRVQIEDNGR